MAARDGDTAGGNRGRAFASRKKTGVPSEVVGLVGEYTEDVIAGDGIAPGVSGGQFGLLSASGIVVCIGPSEGWGGGVVGFCDGEPLPPPPPRKRRTPFIVVKLAESGQPRTSSTESACG